MDQYALLIYTLQTIAHGITLVSWGLLGILVVNGIGLLYFIFFRGLK